MIRHRPEGRGHPYELDSDQLVPAQPVAGELLEIRATTDRAVSQLRLELERAGRVTVMHADPERPRTVGEHGTARGSDTHLSAAAAGAPAGERIAWKVVLDDLCPGETLRYRFVAEGRRPTRGYRVDVASWEQGGRLLAVDGDPRVDRLLPETIQWLRAGDTTHRVRFALRLAPGEHIVGFGERFDALDQRSRTLDTVVFEQYKQQGARTYLPTPFAIVANGGWGFHVSTSRRVWFDVGSTDPDRLWIEVDVAGEGDADLTIELYSGSPHEVLTAYLERTGRPKLPPDWIFTPWISGNEWNTQTRVLAEVDRSKREGIPVGVVVIEAWSDESTFTAFRDAEYAPHPDGSPHRLADFTFPADGAWPDPTALVDELHARGIRVLLWQIPLVKTKAEPDSQLAYDRRALLQQGYVVRQANGRPYANRGWWFPKALLPDFTSAEARAWWTSKRRYLVDEIGIDGFKTDGGEHAWGGDLRYADGTRGAETNNRYPMLYAAAYHELFDNLRDQGITFSRAGFTGSAMYPCHWAGDEDSTWQAFRASITAGLTAGASGIFFWGWDIAGFSGEIPDAELYLRAAAMACLCPIMQYHSEYNHHRVPSRDRTPWNIAERTSDPRVLPTFRRFARLRMRLLPYLIEQARVAVDESKPLMRALFFEVTGDERIWEFPYQYYLGDSVLVSPVTEPGVERLRVYLPAGEWIDPWTNATAVGPTIIERAVPLEQAPVYVATAAGPAVLSLFTDDRDFAVHHQMHVAMEAR